jgi:hypothetical protein
MSMDTGFGFVTKHRERHTRYLDRYESAAADAWFDGGEAYEAFCSQLPAMVSDERNLRIALKYLKSHGGPAPGPDGERLDDIDRIGAWELARQLRDQLRDGSYARGPLRRCRVAKRPGSSAKRTIWVMNLVDRIVARGAAQILLPLLEPVIDERVYSWRRRGTQAALAYVVRQVLTEQRTVWITEDLRDAFDNVPRERLRQVLRHYVPNEECCSLVDQLAARPSRRGILQGSPLSPPLLDVYLSHFLHRPWRRAEGCWPLLSYVDDLWIGCRPDEDVENRYGKLVALIRAMGMRPKLGAERAITHIGQHAVTWLGYRLRLQQEQLTIRSAFFAPTIGERRRQKHQLLVAKFAQLHDRPDGWRDPHRVIQGILGHLAPTLPFEDPRRIHDWITRAAAEAGFREIWSFEELLRYWQAGHERWLTRLDIRQEVSFQATTGQQQLNS